MAEVQLIDLRKSFGHVDVVIGIDLTIRQGEFLALLGPSGCGKTTTLCMLAGFTQPSAGEILVDGASTVGMPPHRRNVGVVFQSYALFPHLSVFDNVAYGLRMRRRPSDEIGERVRRALDTVRLGPLESRGIKQLSGGQQQRVALARALVIEPALLLLDEPLSNLDATLREEMRFEIREIQQRVGITTVFVTHDQSEAMAAADRLVIMNKGRISQIGTAEDVYNAPANAFVAGFIGQANMLRGSVESRHAGSVRVRLGSGQVIVAHTRGSLPEGTAVDVVLRPEHLSLRSESAPEALAGVVERVSFLGSNFNIGVKIGSDSLAVSHPADIPPPSTGQTINVVYDNRSTLAFPVDR